MKEALTQSDGVLSWLMFYLSTGLHYLAPGRRRGGLVGGWGGARGGRGGEGVESSREVKHQPAQHSIRLCQCFLHLI